MSDKPECCPTCNRYTSRGQEQLAVEYRSRPIFETDLSRPLSYVIADIRGQLVKARGQLSDIGSGFTGWKDRVDNVEGLLTCGLVVLWNVQEEMKNHERMYPEATAVRAKKTAQPAPEVFGEERHG